jgi:EpsI family protein
MHNKSGEGQPVAGRTRRAVLVGGAFAGAGLFALFAQPRLHLRAGPLHQLGSLVPDRIGAWQSAEGKGIVLPPADEARENRFYDDIITRYYWSDTAPAMMLLVAYSAEQSGTLQIHRPESCYPAAGFELKSRGSLAMTARGQRFEAQFCSAETADRSEQLLYWTRVGNDFPLSWHDQSSDLRRLNLRGFIPDGILVRISTISDDFDAARLSLQDFARGLLAADTILTNYLIGPAIGGA